MPYIPSKRKIPCRKAHYLAKLCPDAGTVIKLFRSKVFLPLVLRFLGIEFARFIVQQAKMLLLGHGLYIKEKYILKFYFFDHIAFVSHELHEFHKFNYCLSHKNLW